MIGNRYPQVLHSFSVDQGRGLEDAARPYADGMLQAEMRRYVRKDGSAKEHGLYWYFRYHEGGRQRMFYLGKTHDPEGELAQKRP
jgi:hypothetical protein